MEFVIFMVLLYFLPTIVSMALREDALIIIPGELISWVDRHRMVCRAVLGGGCSR